MGVEKRIVSGGENLEKSPGLKHKIKHEPSLLVPENKNQILVQDDQVDEKQRKTYGRTPGGEVFVVPQTHDMLSTLFSPFEPKSLSDILVIGILAAQIALFIALPKHQRVNIFLFIFLFWRTAYNFGIGCLLHKQSNHRTLIYWARKSGIFNAEKHPFLYKIIKKEMTTKITDKDYNFDKAPIEFNTWLVFRRLVDLILMCDFMSYSLLGIACVRVPHDEGFFGALLRWLGGLVLIAFNVWVKLDAHRVVKDYAWYWGDFFFLIDQHLTFDGVFEMAPHPMYSVGYVGYYGLSLITASYTVLFTSLIAHTAQFLFLTIVENPHIDKTYNAPVPRRKSTPSPVDPVIFKDNYPESTTGGSSLGRGTAPDDQSPPKTRPLIGKPDLFRQIDLFTFLLVTYIFSLSFLTSDSRFTKFIFVLHALVWRLWLTIGIGSVLRAQSKTKAWTRHFVRVGEGRNEAWREWRGIYHLTLVGTWCSFLAAGWKCYEAPESWGYGNGFALLTHTLGALLIALQFWTSVSIYESLGEFGWFYGDFFFGCQPKLTYSGIYRYLNNPERLIGCAALWGVYLITRSTSIFFLALVSHFCTLLFIQFVERPHMQKLYGNQIRREAGLVRSIKRAVPPPVKDSVGKVEKTVLRVLNEAQDLVQDILLHTKIPRFDLEGSGIVKSMVKDAGYLFQQYPTLWTIAQAAPDTEGYDSRLYSLTITNTCKTSGHSENDFQSLTVPYGEPIRVKWTAPANHSKKDWIGLYRVADNVSRSITQIASMGRWVATSNDQYDTEEAEEGIITSDQKCVGLPQFLESNINTEKIVEGEVIFSGDKLFWSSGVYEFRYHHDGKHMVMAISLPFEICIPRISEFLPSIDDIDDDRNAGRNWIDPQIMALVAEKLLPVVKSCFDGDEDKGAPTSVDDAFGGVSLADNKYAKRVVYAIKEMFGVDFANEVVTADGNVRRLAWRVCNAKKVLAPFSMSTTSSSVSG